MRKRSKYRPKPIIPNPMAYVLEGMTPVTKYGDYLVTLKIRNHEALANLTQGKATKGDMDLLFNMFNIAEALYRLGFGREYGDLLLQARTALIEVGERGAASGRFLVTGPQMNTINLVMDLHDAQLDLCTIKDVEEATRLVQLEHQRGNVTRVKGAPSANTQGTAGDHASR